MKLKRIFLFHAPILALILLVAALTPGCQREGVSSPYAEAVTTRLSETVPVKATTLIQTETTMAPTSQPIPSTLTRQPTGTAVPEPKSSQTMISQTITPILTTSLTPTAAHSETLAMTATAIAGADLVDRTCPMPPPAKPDYNHYYLSGEPWPTPLSKAEEHFWLAKPLPGGGRFLYTDWLPYGYDAGGRYLLHNGVDSAEPKGTPVLAAADGTVVVAGPDLDKLYGWRCDWYGHLVVIELDDLWLNQPVYLLYGHVLNIIVEPGQYVVRGQQVAEVGSGGAATLPHLHMEVRVGTNEFSATRNPFLWMTPPASRGVIVGRLVDPEGRPWQGVTVAAVGRSEDTETYRSWTYLDDPQHLIGPDEGFAENFVIADVLPGEYELYIEVQDEVYQVPVTVSGGGLVEVEIITSPFKVQDSTLTGSPSTGDEAE